MALKVSLQVQNANGLESFIQATEADIIRGMKAFGQMALDELSNQIKSNSKRPGGVTGKLISTLQSQGVEFFHDPTTHYAEAGVGNYTRLRADKNSIYFYVLDFGVTFTGKKFIPPIPPRGSFGGNPPNSSMVGTGTDSWQTDGSYMMKPRTFRPMFYSSKANFILQGRWETFWTIFLGNKI